jgi:hypothetical protein
MMGIACISLRLRAIRSRMSSTSAQVIRDFRKTTEVQSQIISSQQQTIQKLMQKLEESGLGGVLIDEDHPQNWIRMTSQPTNFSRESGRPLRLSHGTAQSRTSYWY